VVNILEGKLTKNAEEEEEEAGEGMEEGFNHCENPLPRIVHLLAAAPTPTICPFTVAIGDLDAG
jgi:hypothetical protein